MSCEISRKKRFSAATIIDGNDDLLTQILILLPAKSVVRFKSVNKQWQSLISSESFARLHVQNQGRNRAEPQHSFILGDVYGRPQLFICHPTVKKLARVSLHGPLKHFEYVKILQSMNGLLLLSLKLKTTDRIDYVVFNPITMRYRYIHLDGRQWRIQKAKQGSYINDVDGPTGGLNVTFAGPDGRLIGGPVEGLLIAASPVQVIAGSMLAFTSKPKKKAVEDPETSGDPNRGTLGNSVNVHASHNVNPMGGWPSSR